MSRPVTLEEMGKVSAFKRMFDTFDAIFGGDYPVCVRLKNGDIKKLNTMYKGTPPIVVTINGDPTAAFVINEE